MHRYAAHGNIATVMPAALSERNAKGSRRLHGILEKQFVEIAHPIEEEMLGMSVFDGEILRHQRRGIAGRLHGFHRPPA